jgi:hypothetical protein
VQGKEEEDKGKRGKRRKTKDWFLFAITFYPFPLFPSPY